MNRKIISDEVFDAEDNLVISTIYSSRLNGNFRTIKNRIGAEKLKHFFTKHYPRKDIKYLEMITGVPDSSLLYWFKDLGINSTRWHFVQQPIPANFDGSFVANFAKNAIDYAAVNIDSNLAYLIGFCLGDGSVEKYSLEVFNKNEGMKNALKSTMQRYGKVRESIRENGLWRLRLSSSAIARLVKVNKTINEETLDFIFSDAKLIPSFLAGFWDAEGSVLKQRSYFHVYLYNSNKDLLDKISKYLEGNSIKNSIIKVKMRAKTYYYNGRPIVAKKQIYRLGVPKSHIKNWKELIGLHLKHSKKSAVVLEI